MFSNALMQSGLVVESTAFNKRKLVSDVVIDNVVHECFHQHDTPPTWFIKILRQGRIGNIIRVKACAFILNDNTNDIFVKIAFNGYFF